MRRATHVMSTRGDVLASSVSFQPMAGASSVVKPSSRMPRPSEFQRVARASETLPTARKVPVPLSFQGWAKQLATPTYPLPTPMHPVESGERLLPSRGLPRSGASFNQPADQSDLDAHHCGVRGLKAVAGHTQGATHRHGARSAGGGRANV
jgi:hypothetical protein